MTTLSHRNDPQTSYEAAALMERTGTTQTHKEKVLECVKAHPGLIVLEVAEFIGFSQTETARRVSDLIGSGELRYGTPKRVGRKSYGRIYFVPPPPEQGLLL